MLMIPVTAFLAVVIVLRLTELNNVTKITHSPLLKVAFRAKYSLQGNRCKIRDNRATSGVYPLNIYFCPALVIKPTPDKRILINRDFNLQKEHYDY